MYIKQEAAGQSALTQPQAAAAVRMRLFALQDTAYRDFQSRLIPTAAPASVIGVRTPALRALAKELRGQPEVQPFLRALPHLYFEENQLHAFLLEQERDFAAALAGVETFLPYVDNWATCDQLSPAVFQKNRRALLPAIYRWLASGKTYTVRFGIGMLMRYFLEEDFTPAYPALVAAVPGEDYYIRMMAAWYFATALAKQYDAVIGYLENKKLPRWTHNRTIQKAVESYRLTGEQKTYLRTLRWKETGKTAGAK